MYMRFDIPVLIGVSLKYDRLYLSACVVTFYHPCFIQCEIMQEFLYDAKNFCSTYEFELTLVDSTARETVRSNFSYTRAVTSCKRLAVSNVHHYNRILQCPALVKFFCCYFRSYRVSGGTYCVSSEHSVKLFWKMSNYFGIYCVLIVLCYRDMHAESRN